MRLLLAGPGTGKTYRVKSIIKEEYGDAKRILVLSFTNATVNDLKSGFMGQENVRCYTLHSYALKINHLPNLHVLNDKKEVKTIKSYADKLKIEFNELCGFLECITFDNMIKDCIQFIETNPAYASANVGDLDLLVVDEFQDFNEVERELVFLLGRIAKDTIILGDDDQSIYGFKDADPVGIISIYNQDDIEKIQHDNICRRCPDDVVDACSFLIKRNKNRVDKTWVKSGKEGKVVRDQKMTVNETNQYICEIIRSIKNGESILILSPVGFYVPELKKVLDFENIEYKDFWSNEISPEIQEKVWWLKAIYGDHKILFLLCLGKHLRLLRRNNYMQTLKDSFQYDYKESTLVESLVQLSCFNNSLSQYIMNPISFSDFLIRHPEFLELGEHIDESDLRESVNSLEKRLNPSLQFEKDAVNLMSIHKSKGLQADHVFITGLNEGVLPNEVRGLDSIEAFRRLLFVGMTRAIKSLYMLSTVEWDGKFVHRVDKKQFQYKYHKKLYHGKASRFVTETIKGR